MVLKGYQECIENGRMILKGYQECIENARMVLKGYQECIENGRTLSIQFSWHKNFPEKGNIFSKSEESERRKFSHEKKEGKEV